MSKCMAIKEDVKSRLDSIKLCDSETYNNVLTRLLDIYDSSTKKPVQDSLPTSSVYAPTP